MSLWRSAELDFVSYCWNGTLSWRAGRFRRWSSRLLTDRRWCCLWRFGWFRWEQFTNRKLSGFPDDGFHCGRYFITWDFTYFLRNGWLSRFIDILPRLSGSHFIYL